MQHDFEHGLRVQLTAALLDCHALKTKLAAANARADAAEAGWDKADATVEKLANDFATLTDLHTATIARLEEALAAARRECDLLRAELAKCGNMSVPHSHMRPEKP